MRATSVAGLSPVVAGDRFVYRYQPHGVRALTVPDTTATTVALSWLPSADTDIARVDVRADGATVATLAASSTAFVDTGLTAGVTRTYAVIAYAADGLAAPPAVVSATTAAAPRPAAPTQLSNNSQDTAEFCGATPSWIPWQGDLPDFRLTAAVSDPDVSYRSVRVHWTMSDLGVDGTSSPTTLVDPSDSRYWTDEAYENGIVSSSSIDPTLFPDGHVVGVSGVAVDDAGAVSRPSATCRFRYDADRPTAPVVTGSFPPDGTPRVGNTATISFTATEPAPANGGSYSGIDHFEYAFSSTQTLYGDHGTPVPALGSGRTKHGAFSFPMTTWGTTYLFVAAVDAAGNVSEPAPYQFYVVDATASTR